jgi:hypothetical protein
VPDTAVVGVTVSVALPTEPPTSAKCSLNTADARAASTATDAVAAPSCSATTGPLFR